MSAPSALVRKNVRIGTLCTSIKLEPEFWTALRVLAGEGPGRLPALVAKVAATVPPGGNLASALRVHALLNAAGVTIVRPAPRPAVTWVPPGVVPGRRQSQATVDRINAARREART